MIRRLWPLALLLMGFLAAQEQTGVNEVVRNQRAVAVAVAHATTTAQYQLWGLIFITLSGFAGGAVKEYWSARREDKRWERQDGRMNQIHHLANSAVSESMIRELTAQRALLEFMVKTQGDLAVDGKPADVLLNANISSTTISLRLLEVQLAEREKQTAIADAMFRDATLRSARD